MKQPRASVRLRLAATRTQNLWGHAMLVNAGLWLILAAMIALIPLGCILTRTKSKGPPEARH